MSDAHRRKKQPALIRQQLLAVAARLAAQRGIGDVTLDAVAANSGVSKGGLLHHFPTKASLMEAMLDSMLDQLDAAIDAHMRRDPMPHGRFTRGYLRAIVDLRGDAPGKNDWAQATLALLAEPSLRQRWRDWVEKQSEDFVGTDSSVDARIVRFATDGIWLGEVLGSSETSPANDKALIDRLIGLTQK